MKSQSVTTANKWGGRKSEKQSKEAVFALTLGVRRGKRNLRISLLNWKWK